MKVKLFLICVSALFAFFMLFTCADDNNNLVPNGMIPQPTPIEPEVAIVGTWDCTESEDTPKRYLTYNDDNTYEIQRFYKSEFMDDYSIEIGIYAIQNNELSRDRENRGSSDISFEDALHYLKTSPFTYESYFYVDTYIYQDKNANIKIATGSGLVGTWESREVQEHIESVYTTEFKTDNSFTQTLKTTNLDTSYTYDDIITGTYSTDGNGTLILDTIIDEAPKHITVPYRLVNNYNTLVLNPCTRVE